MSDGDSSRSRARDTAEKWLYDNDPDYDVRKYEWQARRTDVLSRERSVHPDFAELRPLNPTQDDGNYITPRRYSERFVLRKDGYFDA